MFHSILWPVDGSPVSIKPMQKVIDLARLSHAEVVLLSIAEPRLLRASDADSVHTGAQAEAIRVDAARHELEQVRAAVQQAGVACRDVVAVSATPGAAIARAAENMHCDLIVMATRGRSGMLDALLDPSTTEEVLKTTAVPVLVFA